MTILSNLRGSLQECVSASVGASALGENRATWYRKLPSAKPAAKTKVARVPVNALSEDERKAVISACNQDEYSDLSIRQVYFRLLDSGLYLASPATMYRIMQAVGQTKVRRVLSRHTKRAKPHLSADGINQVWCWDITYLPGPSKATFFKASVVMDVYSRKALAQRVDKQESEENAVALMESALDQTKQKPRDLVIHQDNGASMISKCFRSWALGKGSELSYSRPRVSDDNPFIESLFSHAKSNFLWPERFETLEEAQAWLTSFIDYYNFQHCHRGLGGHIPAEVYDGSWVTR